MNILRTTCCGLLAVCMPHLAAAQAPTPLAGEPPVPAAVAKQARAFDGALFFTPKQRLEMERDRRQKLAGSPVTPAGDARSVINGVATRSDGRLTVWVDGQPRWESASARHLAQLSSADVGSSAGVMRQAGAENSFKPTQPAKSKKAVKRRNKPTTK